MSVKLRGKGVERLLVLVVGLAMLAGGCGGNGWWGKAEPSVATEERVVADRGWPEQVRYFENVGMGHPSLYLDSFYEGGWGNDGNFNTWDGASGLAVGTELGLFGVDVALMPISMTVARPWQEQVSRSVFVEAEPGHRLVGAMSGAVSSSE